MEEELESAVMVLPDEYQAFLDSLLTCSGADSRGIIVSALNYVNGSGGNAIELVTFDDRHFDGSEFAMVRTGSTETPGLIDLFGEKLVHVRP